jgi:hypothetical protein
MPAHDVTAKSAMFNASENRKARRGLPASSSLYRKPGPLGILTMRRRLACSSAWPPSPAAISLRRQGSP